MWYVNFNTEGLRDDFKHPAYVSAVWVSYGTKPAELQVCASFDKFPTLADIKRIYEDVPELSGRVRNIFYEGSRGYRKTDPVSQYEYDRTAYERGY